MRVLRWRARGVLLASVLLPLAAWGADQSAQNRAPGVPGTINYVEGQVSLDNQPLAANSIGNTILDPGQSLSTQSGKAEILLTPGVFFRLGDNSSARMITSGLTNTELELDSGKAFLEVDQIRPENHLRIRENGIVSQINKTGLYEFDLDGDIVRVFDGEARVEGTARTVTVKSGHELTAENGAMKVEKFDRKQFETGDLYDWSSLRSSYVAEANVNEASYYNEYGFVPGGPLWWGASWYWNPWFSCYTFLPGDGIFYSPFGWGFSSPWWVYRAPFYGYGYNHLNYYHHFSHNPATWGPGEHYAEGHHYANGIYHGPSSMSAGAFHSGGRFVGNGFHGSQGGGFHGGEFFHGGGFGGFHGGGFAGGGHGGGATAR